jgi:hypothetical protein
MVDLCAPLNRLIDPALVPEALERTRLVLLSKVAEDEANRHRASTMLNMFYDVHEDAPTELAHDPRRSFATAGPGQIHRQAKAVEGADRVAVLWVATPEAAAPSKVAEQGGHARSRCQRQGRSLKLAHRHCTSTCGLTMLRRSLGDLLAQSESGF